MVKYAPRKLYIKESGGYVELAYKDFCRRRETDRAYSDKLFIPVQGCLLEVMREQYADFYREKERWRYLKKLDTQNGLLSLDGFVDDEGNALDFIADETADVAQTVIHAVMVDRLKTALSYLSESEQELIKALFFDGLSERETAEQRGVSQSAIPSAAAGPRSLPANRGAAYSASWRTTWTACAPILPASMMKISTLATRSSWPSPSSITPKNRFTARLSPSGRKRGLSKY